MNSKVATERQMIKVGKNNLRGLTGHSKKKSGVSGTIEIQSDEQTSSSSDFNENLASREQLKVDDDSDDDGSPRI